MFVYLLHCTSSDKCYVGQTNQSLSARWKINLYAVRHRKPGCTYLCNAIRKYGPESFTKQLLAEVDSKDKADNFEKLWIILLQTQDSRYGYNITSGGGGLIGFNHSEQTKKKLSAAHKGKQHRLGQHNTKEANEKLSAARRGHVVVSQEQRAIISAVNTGNKYHLGHRHSVEIRAKISAACLAAVKRRKEKTF